MSTEIPNPSIPQAKEMIIPPAPPQREDRPAPLGQNIGIIGKADGPSIPSGNQ